MSNQAHADPYGAYHSVHGGYFAARDVRGPDRLARGYSHNEPPPAGHELNDEDRRHGFDTPPGSFGFEWGTVDISGECSMWHAVFPRETFPGGDIAADMAQEAGRLSRAYSKGRDDDA